MPRASSYDLSAKSFSELVSGPVVVVHVGPQRKHWFVHRNLLAFSSEYFKFKGNNNNESEALEDLTIELLDDDPDAFDLFVKWLYQGRIDDVSTLPMEEKWNYAYACQKLYMLCERIGVQDLKNLAIDQFRKGCYEAALVPGPEEMLPIYEQMTPSSPFRKLVSQIAARQIMDPHQDVDAATYKPCFQACPEFAIDVINAIRRATGGFTFDDPTNGNSCKYHEHLDGETCRKTVKFSDDPLI